MTRERVGLGPVTLTARIEQWPLAKPFRTASYVWEYAEVLVVELERNGNTGRGEAAGVYYLRDQPALMLQQVLSLKPSGEAGIDRDTLQAALPPGGARNAVDCALWDLEAKSQGRPAWRIAGLGRPEPLVTTFTCGADEPEIMAECARAYSETRALKIKLTGSAVDAQRVKAVRASRPDVWLGVDANQGYTTASFAGLLPSLIEARVDLIEQPFQVGHEAPLDVIRSPIPIAADESAQTSSDIAALVGRFDTVNIKLDKCGGLTEGLAMVRAAKQAGLRTMVGCMPGTSLAIAPALLLGQMCAVVDLDAPIFLARDRSPSVRYIDGLIGTAEGVWGDAR